MTHAGRPSAVNEIIHPAQGLLMIPLPTPPRSSLNLGRPEGGMAINAIAAQASLEVDLRSEDETIVAGLKAAVSVQASAQATADAEVERGSVGSRPGAWSRPTTRSSLRRSVPARAAHTMCTVNLVQPTPAPRSAWTFRPRASACPREHGAHAG